MHKVLWVIIAKNIIMIDTKFGDVTGDGIYDRISLIGNYLSDDKSSVIENFKILISDGKTDLIYEISIPYIIGYQPTLFLYSFRNKEVSDIVVSIDSGGSGGFGYYYIFGYDGIRFNKLFDSSTFNNLFKYQVKYLNDYQVEIINDTLKMKYILDISSRDTEYLNQIYNENTTLKNPVSGYVSNLNRLFPIDINNDSIFELLTFQRVTGLYNADLIGYLQTVLLWQENHFDIFCKEQFLSQLGYDIN